MQIYTMGYLAGRADKKLRDLIAIGIPLVDTRYSPESKHWQWTKGYLETTAGLSYYWIQELGNINYKASLNGKFAEQGIQIKDIDTGIGKLTHVLQKHGKACLLCACNGKHCHRFVIANETVNRLGIKVTHI